MVNLYLLRHGETEENVRHILQGHLPGTLTPQGMQQAATAAHALLPIPFDTMLVSDLHRCTHTADILFSEWQRMGKHPLPTRTSTPLLRERDWGSATGMVVSPEHRITIPDDVESISAIKARARIFLDFVSQTYPHQTVLAVSHGFFCRILQVVFYNKEIADIQPMKNVETRCLQLP